MVRAAVGKRDCTPPTLRVRVIIPPFCPRPCNPTLPNQAHQIELVGDRRGAEEYRDPLASRLQPACARATRYEGRRTTMTD